MSIKKTAPTAPRHANTASDTSARLSGRTLGLVRVLWFVMVIMTLALWILSIPLAIAQLQILCSGTDCKYLQLTAANVQVLQQLGVSLNAYIGYVVVVNSLSAMAFMIVGALIFWLKSRDWMGLHTSLALVIFGTIFSGQTDLVVARYPALQPVTLVLVALGTVLFFIFFYVFPDGHFVPRWTCWLIPLLVAGSTADAIFVNSQIWAVYLPIAIATAILAQVYRYRRVSNTVQREQTKWVVYGSVVAGLGSVLLILLSDLVPARGTTNTFVMTLVNATGQAFFYAFVPLSIMMAILRFRLYDINRLINRTLVYLPLTAILAGIFSASITLTQKLFVAVTGQSSDAATVLTTLIVVAAFEPLRTGLRHLVDRHFGQRKQRFAEFREQLRTFVELHDGTQVMHRLLTEAIKTLDAKGGAIYLEENGSLRLLHQIGDWKGVSKMSVPLSTNGTHLGTLELAEPRKRGEYTDDDRASVMEISDWAGRVIYVAQRSEAK